MYKIAGKIEIDNIISEWEPTIAEFAYKEIHDDYSGHDIYHCLRVKNLSVIIAKAENMDIDVLVATAYLHDTGRGGWTNWQDDHVKIGIEKAKAILPKSTFPKNKVDRVLSCIEKHEDYIWNQSKNQVDETNRDVLGFQDADRLDAMGAIGVARVFAFGGANHVPLWVPEIPIGNWEKTSISPSSYNHLHEKILKLLNAMNTKTGKNLAQSRYEFVKRFAETFKEEWFSK